MGFRSAYVELYFYPRPPRGGRQVTPKRPGTGKTVFLPTPSTRRATPSSCMASGVSFTFLPTPSTRRATGGHFRRRKAQVISTHALHEEGDDPAMTVWDTFRAISTHALHEEGDGERTARGRAGSHISTHALHEEGDQVWLQIPPGSFISTHALHEEGDKNFPCFPAYAGNFYPRPPRGGRPFTQG